MATEGNGDGKSDDQSEGKDKNRATVEDGKVLGTKGRRTKSTERRNQVTQNTERKDTARQTRSRSRQGDRNRSRSKPRRGSRDRDGQRKPTSDMTENKVSMEKTKTNEGMEKTALKVMNTAAMFAKSVMGITEEKAGMTIAVKKEKAEENERYTGERTKEIWISEKKTTNSPSRNRNVPETTKPTPVKRKSDDVKTPKSTDSKKKRSEQQKLTPVRMVIERDRKNLTTTKRAGTVTANEEAEEEEEKQKRTSPYNGDETSKKKGNKTPCRNKMRQQETNTPQIREEYERNDDAQKEYTTNKKMQEETQEHTKQTEKRSREQDEITRSKLYHDTVEEKEVNEKKTPVKPPNIKRMSINSNKATTTPAKTIENPYEKQSPRSKETEKEKAQKEAPTPTSNNKQQVSYANAVEGKQTKLQTHAKKRGKHNHRFELSFLIEDPNQHEPEKELSNLREILTAILKRAKEVDKNSMINTWRESSHMRTVEKVEDLPFTPNDLKMYLNHPYNDRKIQKKNNGWRINLSFSIPYDLFLHYWELSKRDYTEVKFVSLKDAPMQSERYYNCGTFINSSDGQITKQLSQKLTTEIGKKIHCAFRPAPLDKSAADFFWKNAYEQAKTGRGNIYRYAPMSLNVYAQTPEDARQTAKHLLQKYGTQTPEGQYPKTPDGSRMRFIPANRFLDMAGRDTAKNLFANQIQFNANHVKLPLPIQSIDTTFEEHEGRSIMELILDMECEEKENEPFFRHVTRRWTRDFKEKRYTVSVHKEMLHDAQRMIEHLKEELQLRYGDKVAAEVIDREEEEERRPSSASYSVSTMTLDTNDRYLNGPARFIIEGMDALSTTEKSTTLATKRAQEEDNYTMEVVSKGTNDTNETFASMKGPASTENGIHRVPQQIKPNKAHNSERNKTTGASAREDEADHWERVGSETAEIKLHQTITNQTNHDPGGKPGGGHF